MGSSSGGTGAGSGFATGSGRGNGSFLTSPRRSSRPRCSTLAIDGPGFGGSAALEPEEYAIDHLAASSGAWSTGSRSGGRCSPGHSWGGASRSPPPHAGPRTSRPRPVRQRTPRLRRRSRRESRRDGRRADRRVEADPCRATWDELVALLAEHELDQAWTLAAWREGSMSTRRQDPRLATNVALAASRRG